MLKKIDQQYTLGLPQYVNTLTALKTLLLIPTTIHLGPSNNSLLQFIS
jgi:hypothetical protein